jgi:hypothetical protein
VATGTPGQLGGRDQLPSRVRFRLPGGQVRADLPSDLAQAAASLQCGRTEIVTANPQGVLLALTAWAKAGGYLLAELEVLRPTLEETYLTLTAGGVQ